MELNVGICTICSSNNEVVKSEDCSIYWGLITEIFKEDIPNLNEYEVNVKLCPSCIYKITLIDSKKAILHNEPKETNSNICNLCNLQMHTKLFKVGPSKVLRNFGLYKRLQRAESSICSECYFVIDCMFSLENSMKKLSKMRHSKRKSIENIEKPPDIPKTSLPIQTAQTSVSPLLNTTSDDVEHEEKENKSIRSQRARPRIHKNGQKNSDMPEKSSPKTKSKNVDLAEDEGSNKRKIRTKTSEDEKLEIPNGNLKFTTSRKNNKSPKIETASFAVSRVKLEKTDPVLSSLVPLCALNVELSEEIKTDNKFFKLIPYIKLADSIEKLKIQNSRQNNGASISKITSKGPKETKVTGRRTPPIKIKFKQGKVDIGIKNKRNKSPPEQVENSVDKRKVVIKVARLKILKSEDDQLEEKEINEINDVSVVEDESYSSKDFTTPKKKKKVHFNDTPTIIITGDDDEEPSNDVELEEVESRIVLEDTKEATSEIESSSKKVDTVEVQEDDITESVENIGDKIDSEENGVLEKNKLDLEENTEDNVEEIIEEKIEELKEDETVLIGNDEVVKHSQIFEIRDDEDESQSQGTETLEKEDDVECVDQVTVEENGVDEKSSSDQNSIDKDTALLDLDIIDECSNDDDVERTDFSMDTQSTLGKIIDTNDDNDVIINNEMLSDAADDKENFGSLIDEVQKCLTSSEDFTGLSKKQDTECPTVEMIDDDSLTCLQDLEVLKGSFAEELIPDDIVEKQLFGSKRCASSTSSEVSSKKSRFN